MTQASSDSSRQTSKVTSQSTTNDTPISPDSTDRDHKLAADPAESAAKPTADESQILPTAGGQADKSLAADDSQMEVVITSPQPDVVIAQLNPSESDRPPPQDNHQANGNPSDPTTQTESPASTKDHSAAAHQVPDEHQDASDYCHPRSDQTEAQDQPLSAYSDTIPTTTKATKASLQGADSQVSRSGSDNRNLDPEPVKHEVVAILDKEQSQEEREAQLESYKQFVAQQENNREIDYPSIRVKIEANALPSKMYFLMNTLSAIIASYGLVANSAAVVIGAMLVAMMLGPITGVALAIIDYRMPLLRKSLFTVAAGGLLVVGVGFVVGTLHQGHPLTNEILSRTQPTSMDLMIALAGGTAGAYAMISPHLSVAVVGVAVATALVPPLAASGILFANGEVSLGLGAFLLAVTNIIAIQFTNAMVLWFSGFRRLVNDDYKSGTYLIFFRRNAVTLLLLVGLGIYLSFNLNSIAKQQRFETEVKSAINDYFIDKGNVLTNTQFDKANGYRTIRAVVRGETDPSPYDVQQIEAAITQKMDDISPNHLPIKLQLRYLPIQVIESNPLIKDKLDETDAAILTN